MCVGAAWLTLTKLSCLATDKARDMPPVATPRDKPTVIIQTKTIRVIRQVRDRSAEKRECDKLDDIYVETLRTDAMGAEFWFPTYTLWNLSMSMAKDEKFMLQLFNELPLPIKMDTHDDKIVMELPDKPRFIQLANILSNISGAFKDGRHAEPSDWPFDNRDGQLLVTLVPAERQLLHKLYPDSTLVEAIKKLLEEAAVELVK